MTEQRSRGSEYRSRNARDGRCGQRKRKDRTRHPSRQQAFGLYDSWGVFCRFTAIGHGQGDGVKCAYHFDTHSSFMNDTGLEVRRQGIFFDVKHRHNHPAFDAFQLVADFYAHRTELTC